MKWIDEKGRNLPPQRIREGVIKDLEELKTTIQNYRVFLSSWGNPDLDVSLVKMHDVIEHTDTETMGKALQLFNVNQSNIITEIRETLRAVEDFVRYVGNVLPELKRTKDPEISKVFQFFDKLSSVLQIQLVRLETREDTDPALGDVQAASKLQSFIGGDYGNMSFETFLNKYIVTDNGVELPVIAKSRRLNYLNDNCTDKDIKERLKDYQEQRRQTDTPEPQQTTSVQTVKDHKQTKKNGIHITIDDERLRLCFNAAFKGAGQNPNYFDDLIQYIKNIKQMKQIGMVAAMIYNCRYFIKRPSTFTAWLREFCEICGVDCPKETSLNKYKPNENIQRTLYYLRTEYTLGQIN